MGHLRLKHRPCGGLDPLARFMELSEREGGAVNDGHAGSSLAGRVRHTCIDPDLGELFGDPIARAAGYDTDRGDAHRATTELGRWIRPSVNRSTS